MNRMNCMKRLYSLALILWFVEPAFASSNQLPPAQAVPNAVYATNAGYAANAGYATTAGSVGAQYVTIPGAWGQPASTNGFFATNFEQPLVNGLATWNASLGGYTNANGMLWTNAGVGGTPVGDTNAGGNIAVGSIASGHFFFDDGNYNNPNGNQAAWLNLSSCTASSPGQAGTPPWETNGVINQTNPYSAGYIYFTNSDGSPWTWPGKTNYVQSLVSPGPMALLSAELGSGDAPIMQRGQTAQIVSGLLYYQPGVAGIFKGGYLLYGQEGLSPQAWFGRTNLFYRIYTDFGTNSVAWLLANAKPDVDLPWALMLGDWTRNTNGATWASPVCTNVWSTPFSDIQDACGTNGDIFWASNLRCPFTNGIAVLLVNTNSGSTNFPDSGTIWSDYSAETGSVAEVQSVLGPLAAWRLRGSWTNATTMGTSSGATNAPWVFISTTNAGALLELFLSVNVGSNATGNGWAGGCWVGYLDATNANAAGQAGPSPVTVDPLTGTEDPFGGSFGATFMLTNLPAYAFARRGFTTASAPGGGAPTSITTTAANFESFVTWERNMHKWRLGAVWCLNPSYQASPGIPDGMWLSIGALYYSGGKN